jgi:hypothetical protein
VVFGVCLDTWLCIRAWSLEHFQSGSGVFYSKACTASMMNISTIKCHCGIESLIDLVRFGVL